MKPSLSSRVIAVQGGRSAESLLHFSPSAAPVSLCKTEPILTKWQISLQHKDHRNLQYFESWCGSPHPSSSLTWCSPPGYPCWAWPGSCHPTLCQATGVQLQSHGCLVETIFLKTFFCFCFSDYLSVNVYTNILVHFPKFLTCSDFIL